MAWIRIAWTDVAHTDTWFNRIGTKDRFKRDLARRAKRREKKGEGAGKKKGGADLRTEKRGDAELPGKATEEQPRSPRSSLATEEKKRKTKMMGEWALQSAGRWGQGSGVVAVEREVFSSFLSWGGGGTGRRDNQPRSSVEVAQAEGRGWSKGTDWGGSGERWAGAAHEEEMGRRALGAAHAGEIEAGPKDFRARENEILNLDHPKCIEWLSFVAHVATVTTMRNLRKKNF
jgi:hypothetical protein